MICRKLSETEEEGTMFLLQSYAHKTIWGGEKLIPYAHGETGPIGHLYSVRCTAQDSSRILTGPYRGQTMNTYFSEVKEKFSLSGYAYFPLVIALTDACDNLSIQVHPDDETVPVLDAALQRGKNESWFFIDAPEDGTIFCGCTLTDMGELRSALIEGRMEEVTKRLPVHRGDYIHVQAGTLHALSKGSLVFEIEENGGATYRFFDFNRTDSEGHTRPLHIPQAFFAIHPELESHTRTYGDGPIEERRYLTRHFDAVSEYRNSSDTLQVFTVLKGSFPFDGIEVLPGMSFILEPGDVLHTPAAEAIVSQPKPL